MLKYAKSEVELGYSKFVKNFYKIAGGLAAE